MATRLRSQTLYRVIAIMLGLIAVVLLFGHSVGGTGAMLTGVAQMVVGGRRRFLHRHRERHPLP